MIEPKNVVPRIAKLEDLGSRIKGIFIKYREFQIYYSQSLIQLLGHVKSTRTP